MKKLNLIQSGDNIDRNRFENEIRALGIESVPIDFTSFYLQYNPIQLKENIVKNSSRNYENSLRIRNWFPIKEHSLNQWDSLQSVYNNSRSFLPSFFIPFACNDMDDFYILSVRKDDFGSVYFLRNDMYFEEVGALTLLSNSFSSFLNKLEDNSGQSSVK